eukprot:7141505-Heterocapsa_arctica.AAC.1
MAQQSLILTELQKEDPGNPATNLLWPIRGRALVMLGLRCLSAYNSNIQDEDVELDNIKIALGLAAE